MSVFDKFLGRNQTQEKWVSKSQPRGPLAHVFLFDSGPIFEDKSKYVVHLLESLLPEALGNTNAPVKFVLHETMPDEIGWRESPNRKQVMDYGLAWATIANEAAHLAEGIKGKHPKNTFGWKEYHTKGGNRGILYAFYKLL